MPEIRCPEDSRCRFVGWPWLTSGRRGGGSRAYARHAVGLPKVVHLGRTGASHEGKVCTAFFAEATRGKRDQNTEKASPWVRVRAESVWSPRRPGHLARNSRARGTSEGFWGWEESAGGRGLLRPASMGALRTVQAGMTQERPGVSLTPNLISLPRISLLRFIDSRFPGNSLWAWEFHPLKLRLIMLESNPLKSRIAVQRLAVPAACAAGRRVARAGPFRESRGISI